MGWNGRGSLLLIIVIGNIALGSCTSSEQPNDGDVPDDTASPANGDTGIVVVDTGIADDTRGSGDIIGDSSDTCQDLRHPNDYKQASDRCWDPPEHYCSQGGSTWVVRGCNSDFSLCCTFATSCIPCGWHDCNNDPDARCDTAPLDTSTCQDPQILPDFDASFCFD